MAFFTYGGRRTGEEAVQLQTTVYLTPDNYNEKVVRNSCTEQPTVRTEIVLVS